VRAFVFAVAMLGLAVPAGAKPLAARTARPGRAEKPPPPARETTRRTAPASAARRSSPSATDTPEILLTFDDGPALDKTPKVLDILDARGIKAVFFVTGRHFQGTSERSEKSRELLREIARRGHAIGNHTVHHYFLCGSFYSLKAGEEIEENANLIHEAVGIRPDLFRTPFGAHCKKLSATLAGLGIQPIGWDIDPQDWKLRDSKKIYAYVTSRLAKLRGRAIVLFHDVQAATVKALPDILDWIDKENAARLQAGRPPIKIIDYAYLLPKRQLVPPLLDALGRILIDAVVRTTRGAVPLCPALAWPPPRV
jgi:peptidoglycan/xylan/chitin deacetylase (PgdA/CDA1 family)